MMLREFGARAVLVKGGHLAGETVTDVLVEEGGVHRFSGPRIASAATHGTGCTLASAIAMGLAQSSSLQDAIHRARAFVRQAMRTRSSLFRPRDRAAQPSARNCALSPLLTREGVRGTKSHRSRKGSRTRIVSSRSGLVERSATGAPISSSTRLIYLMAVAGSSPQERAPRVDPLQPSKVS